MRKPVSVAAMAWTSSSAVASSARSAFRRPLPASLSMKVLICPANVSERDAAVTSDLAEEEVLSLDGRRAFVQRVDLGVADVLLDRVVLQEAGSTEGLQAVRQVLVRTLGADALDDREQQVVDAERGVLVCARDELGDNLVLVSCGVEVHRAPGLRRMPSALPGYDARRGGVA